MSSNVEELYGQDPYITAKNVLAVASEFKAGIKRTEPLWPFLDGGTTCSSRKREWMCAGFGVTKRRLRNLVHVLVEEGHLKIFFADEAALPLLSIGLLEQPCREYVSAITTARARAEQSAREEAEFHFGT